jgi:hypothetical protein
MKNPSLILFYLFDNIFVNLYSEVALTPMKLMLANAGLNLVGLFLFVTSAKMGYITLVNALVAVQPFFVLSFALILHYFYPLLLKESFEKASLLKKMFATLLMFTGVILIH